MTKNGSDELSGIILLGRRIRNLRKRKGITIAELAEMAEISQKHLGEIELGKQNPTIETIERISHIFNMSLSELFDFEHHVEPDTIRDELAKLIEETGEDQLQKLYRVFKSIIE